MAIEILRPNAVGDETSIPYAQPSGTHWDKVSEATADDDTTYVNTLTTTYVRDLYNLPAHSVGSGTITSITIYFRVKSVVTSYAYGKPSQKSGATVTDGTERWEVTTTWTTFSQTYTTNPATGIAYTWDEIDNLQIGVSIRTPSGGAIRCTQVYVEVNYDTGISAVGKTVQTVWNIRSLIAKTNQAVWNVKTAIGGTSQLVHNILTTIGNTSQYIWNVLTTTAIGAVFQLVWNIRSLIAKTNQYIYHVWFGNTIQLKLRPNGIGAPHLSYPPGLDRQYPGETLYEHYNTGDNSALDTHGTTWLAQTFTPTTSHKLTAIRIKVNRQGGAISGARVSIRATDGSGHPTGSDLIYADPDFGTGFLAATDLWSWIVLGFSQGAGVNLTASTKYAIVLRATGSTYPSSYLRWLAVYPSPTYTGGNAERSYDSGVTWSAESTFDFMFEEWDAFSANTYHWDKVDEVVSDDASTYIFRDNLGIHGGPWEVFDLEQTSASGGIQSVKVSALCHWIGNVPNQPTGTTLQLFVRTHGVLYGNPVNYPPAGEQLFVPDYETGWVIRWDNWLVNPFTEVAWTWDEINALEAGLSLDTGESLSTGGTACISQVYVGVDYTVVTSIGKTSQSVWNILTPFYDTIQGVWNTRNVVTQARQLLYNLRYALGKTTQNKWNVWQAVSDTIQHLWNIRSAIGDTIQNQWHTHSLTTKTVQLVHNVLTSIGKTSQSIWKLRVIVMKWGVKTTGDKKPYIWRPPDGEKPYIWRPPDGEKPYIWHKGD